MTQFPRIAAELAIMPRRRPEAEECDHKEPRNIIIKKRDCGESPDAAKTQGAVIVLRGLYITPTSAAQYKARTKGGQCATTIHEDL